MAILQSLVMALSCFSRIPMPHVEYKPESMRYMMCFFPLVGVIVGLLIWLWCSIAMAAELNAIMLAAGITVIPIAVTGAIHLDGLADCIDAQASHAAPEKKREILKDPHTGAFAVIGIACYLLLYFAIATEFKVSAQTILLICCMHTMSRCLSAIATLVFPTSTENGMLASFHVSAERRPSLIAIIIVFLACAAVMLFVQPFVASAMIAAGLICFLATRIFANTQFGGMSGDIAGAFLQIAELAMLACLVFFWKAVMG